MRNEILIVLSILFLYYIFSLIRFIFFDYNTFIPDIKECIKMLSLVYVMIFYKRDYDNGKNIYNSLFIFTVINFISVVIQFLNINIFNLKEFIFKLYNLDGTRPIVFSSIVRAPGLSPGPGEQGSISALLLVYFIFYLLSEKKKISIIPLILNFLMIVLSQSRTSIISSIIIVILLMFTILFLDTKKNRITILFIQFMIIAFVIFLYYINPNLFYYIGKVFTHKISSFSVRVSKWESFMSSLFSNPVFLIIGLGRNLKGSDAKVFDNEYVFNFTVFGLFISTVIYILYSYTLLRCFKRLLFSYNSTNYFFKTISFGMIYFLISGLALIVFFEPRFMIMYFIFLIHSKPYLERRAL